MPRKTTTPPSREKLVDFFRDRRDRPVGEIAALLGSTVTATTRRARHERVLLRGGMVAWADAALWLLETWSAVGLVRLLDADADTLPAGFFPLRVELSVPAYVLHALGVQWRAGGQCPPTLEDYLGELLFDCIQPATVDLLEHDAEFMRAYEFPEGETGE